MRRRMLEGRSGLCARADDVADLRWITTHGLARSNHYALRPRAAPSLACAAPARTPTPLRPSAPGRFRQLAAEELSGGSAREAGDEVHALGDLEVGELAGAVGPQIVLGDLGLTVEDHQRADRLLPLRIR